MPNPVDITGQVFGRLTAIKRVRVKKDKTYWLCDCACGNQANVYLNHLRTGHTRSCGCLHTESVRRPRTHGRSRTGVYGSWKGMLSRCTQPSSPAYEHYRKRGITVCERWHSFENFLADMGERPEGMTLDRINNDKNYEPGNCRWATWKEQANNRSDNSGELNPAAKLTDEQVRAIRADSRRQAIIAAEYGVQQQHISRIKNGRRRATS